MKIKIRPDDTSRLRENDWFQTDGWLAGLRDDGRADPAADGHAGPERGSDPWPEICPRRGRCPRRGPRPRGGCCPCAGCCPCGG